MLQPSHIEAKPMTNWRVVYVVVSTHLKKIWSSFGIIILGRDEHSWTSWLGLRPNYG
jgi:hypothetical protein